MHMDIQTSMALGYDTLGILLLDPDSWVAIVSTVVTPNEILAGTASRLIQNDTQDKITIKMEGIYVCNK